MESFLQAWRHHFPLAVAVGQFASYQSETIPLLDRNCQSKDYPELLGAVLQHFATIKEEFLNIFQQRGGKLTPLEEERFGRWQMMAVSRFSAFQNTDRPINLWHPWPSFLACDHRKLKSSKVPDAQCVQESCTCCLGYDVFFDLLVSVHLCRFCL